MTKWANATALRALWEEAASDARGRDEWETAAVLDDVLKEMRMHETDAVEPVIRCAKCHHALKGADGRVQYCNLRNPIVPTESENYCSWAAVKIGG